ALRWPKGCHSSNRPAKQSLVGQHRRMKMRNLIPVVSVLLAVTARAGEPLRVDPEAGNSNFSAVFDAPLGERINAVSSHVSCDLTYDATTATASGVCSVPLTSIVVDNLPLKTEHFQQWSTHKKSDPKLCTFEAKLSNIKLDPPLAPNTTSKFSTAV